MKNRIRKSMAAMLILAASGSMAATPAWALETGKVKFYNETKDFGFIEQGEGRDVFVHFSAIQGTNRTLVEGQKVQFTITQTPKGPQAESVVIVDGN